MVRAAGVLAAAFLVAGPGCITHERPETGKPPEGRIRVPGATESRSRGDPAAGAEGSGGPTSPASSVVGVKPTGIFHREGCTVLAESAPDSRVTFASSWAANEADYTPCSHCRPGW